MGGGGEEKDLFVDTRSETRRKGSHMICRPFALPTRYLKTPHACTHTHTHTHTQSMLSEISGALGRGEKNEQENEGALLRFDSKTRTVY